MHVPSVPRPDDGSSNTNVCGVQQGSRSYLKMSREGGTSSVQGQGEIGLTPSLSNALPFSVSGCLRVNRLRQATHIHTTTNILVVVSPEQHVS